MEWINIISQLVGSLGFPIVVVGWLLWERSTTTKDLTNAIMNNTKVMELLLDEIKGGNYNVQHFKDCINS